MIGKAKLGFIQFVTQSVLAYIQAKIIYPDRKIDDLMNIHCWAGLELIEKYDFFVIFYNPMKLNVGKLSFKKLGISSKCYKMPSEKVIQKWFKNALISNYEAGRVSRKISKCLN